MSSLPDAPHKGGVLHAVLHLSISILPEVLAQTEFWFMLGVHLLTWGGYQSGWFQVKYEAAAVSVDWIDLKMLTVMTTFFMAFYVNQCFTRYQHICFLLHRVFASVHDFAYQARLFLRGEKPYDRLASRWLGACTLLSLAELRHGELDDERWRKFTTHQLVLRSEVDFFRGMSGRQRLLAIAHMAAELTKTALEGDELLEVLQGIMSYKECHQELLDVVKLEVPFCYQHLLSITVFMNLLLLAYGMALSESCLAPGLFIIMDLVLLGMADIAKQVWNPFRSHAVGFAMDQWAEDFLAGLKAVLDYEHDGATEKWQSELQEEHRADVNLHAQAGLVCKLLEGAEAWPAPEHSASQLQTPAETQEREPDGKDVLPDAKNPEDDPLADLPPLETLEGS